jgi:putative alpha-1,2-mannosidase
MSAMGFYAVDPVSANYVFGAPLFDKVTPSFAEGKHSYSANATQLTR